MTYNLQPTTYNQRGFSLAETLVAIAILMLMMGSVSGLMLSAIAAQRRALAVQELVSQTSYIAEYMSRHIRQARKETGQGCLSQQGTNYQLTFGGQGLKFVNSQNECQEFSLDAGRVKEVRGAQTEYLTSAEPVSIVCGCRDLVGFLGHVADVVTAHREKHRNRKPLAEEDYVLLVHELADNRPAS